MLSVVIVVFATGQLEYARVLRGLGVATGTGGIQWPETEVIVDLCCRCTHRQLCSMYGRNAQKAEYPHLYSRGIFQIDALGKSRF